jgi:transcriptional regulator with XRE-family HTH domain
LRRDLLEDEGFRTAYAESFLNTSVAAQIKAIREQRDMTQAELAEAIGTKQAGISRLENVNYSSWKTETLRRIARALKVRLRISFEDFGSLVDEVDKFGREALQRPKPEDDRRLKQPVKKEPVTTTDGSDLKMRTGFASAVHLHFGTEVTGHTQRLVVVRQVERDATMLVTGT